MTRDDIIRMAREAGAIPIHGKSKEFALARNERLERFAALVAAAEREQCAKVCEAHGLHEYFPTDPRRHVTYAVAAAIRVREWPEGKK